MAGCPGSGSQGRCSQWSGLWTPVTGPGVLGQPKTCAGLVWGCCACSGLAVHWPSCCDPDFQDQFFTVLKSVSLIPYRQREVLIAHLALCALPYFQSSTELGTLRPKTHGSSAACLWTSERCWAVLSYFSRGQATPGQMTANALQDPQALPLRSLKIWNTVAAKGWGEVLLLCYIWIIE